MFYNKDKGEAFFLYCFLYAPGENPLMFICKPLTNANMVKLICACKLKIGYDYERGLPSELKENKEKLKELFL
jgi:hypothetical protein